ncbi:MAG: MFS transporter [Nannocystaceae bacterium]|nr:MFS transporter [Nannocystaceae bacterium]
MPPWLEKFLPILGLLAVIALVLVRLPRVDVGHSDAFLRRRIRNWLPVGMLYAFLYMGRYNLTAAKKVFEDMTNAAGEVLMTNADFATIFGVGTAVYGTSFLINGPLTDRIGGKKALLIGGVGAAVANLAMGIVAYLEVRSNLILTLSLLYAVNMYFQSFGAVSIVKINAPWFHVRERGVFGAIFGILISLGIYLAFDVGSMIVKNFPVHWVFFVPSIVLTIAWFTVYALAKNTPGEAGHPDFDTADDTEDGPPLKTREVFLKMLRNPIILTIAFIEFCSGFLRQAIMQWYPTFAKATGEADNFVNSNWGMLLCCAGILGGVFAGVLSDRVFGSRRGPVAAILYGAMLVGSVVMISLLGHPMLGAVIVAMSLCVIGVHGMLTGTASMDFGGRRNTGTAVGIIDGFVYAGTALMAVTYGIVLPEGEAAANIDNWFLWPVLMVPMAVIGLFLARRLWHAAPKKVAAKA